MSQSRSQHYFMISTSVLAWVSNLNYLYNGLWSRCVSEINLFIPCAAFGHVIFHSNRKQTKAMGHHTSSASTLLNHIIEMHLVAGRYLEPWNRALNLNCHLVLWNFRCLTHLLNQELQRMKVYSFEHKRGDMVAPSIVIPLEMKPPAPQDPPQLTIWSLKSLPPLTIHSTLTWDCISMWAIQCYCLHWTTRNQDQT